MSSCNKTSDNKFLNCAARMSDGRWTNWEPRCKVNFDVNAPLDSYSYRQYLINNGEKIMNDQRVKAYKTNSCGPCFGADYNVGTMGNEQTVQKCNNNVCTFVTKDANGLGLGRQYSDQPSAFEQNFLKQKNAEQANFRKSSNNCTNSTDNLDLWLADGVMTSMIRSAVPSGAPLR